RRLPGRTGAAAGGAGAPGAEQRRDRHRPLRHPGRPQRRLPDRHHRQRRARPSTRVADHGVCVCAVGRSPAGRHRPGAVFPDACAGGQPGHDPGGTPEGRRPAGRRRQLQLMEQPGQAATEAGGRLHAGADDAGRVRPLHSHALRPPGDAAGQTGARLVDVAGRQPRLLPAQPRAGRSGVELDRRAWRAAGGGAVEKVCGEPVMSA
ncbi:hypothetical protein COLO4_01216, partial [Corchorus olitorius]